ncbi:MAG TPA: hypothetical protein VFV33_05035 [Gemmatimonadaceae bacterium]|nr:hypothetical protein [Gemmatimonadaceae bacterium]
MRSPCRTSAILLLLASSLTACGSAEERAPASPTVAVDTAAVRAGVDDLWAKWAAADTAEDLDAILALATEDVRLDIRGVPPMVRRDSARTVMRPMYAQLDYLEASASPRSTVAITNALAHQTGTYRERYTMKGERGERTDHGRYAAALVKGDDGQWRWAYMMAMVDSTTTKP